MWINVLNACPQSQETGTNSQGNLQDQHIDAHQNQTVEIFFEAFRDPIYRVIREVSVVIDLTMSTEIIGNKLNNPKKIRGR